jgi:hypothetical protein
MRQLARIVIHHSGTPRDVSIESMKRDHQRRGWDGIGYHYVIDGDAELRMTRDVKRIGAHAIPWNHDSIGICVCGDNTTPGQEWTESQISVLRRLIANLRQQFPEIGSVLGHRDLPQTTTLCPGLSVRALFAQIERLEGGEPMVSTDLAPIPRTKPWYTSKTLWVNLISLIASGVQAATGFDVISPQVQVAVLAGVNMFLRLLTSTNSSES